MKTEYQYLRFVEIAHEDRKTRLFSCNTTRTSAVLGFVFWYAPWRQYCFEPGKETVFSGGCLADIQDFIRQLMEERKQ